MSGVLDGIPNSLRARVAPVLLVVCILFGVLLAAPEIRPDAWDSPVHTEAVAVSALRIVANRTLAARNDSVQYTMWLNLTGGGSVQYAWVNVTFDLGLLPDASSATTPSGCARGVNTTWQCNGLRAGVYVWTIRAAVTPIAPTAQWANATASVLTYTNRQYSPVVQDLAEIWIAAVILDLGILSDPANTIRLGEKVHFTIAVSNDRLKNDEPAYDVNVHINVSPGLSPSAGQDYHNDSLTAGSVVIFSLDLVVDKNASVGNAVLVLARLTYQDFNYHPIGPVEASKSLLVQPAEVVSTTNLVAGLLVGVLTVLLVVAVLLFTGQRRLRIDEVFLVHSSGALIQHVSHEHAIKKDDDLMAAMLIAVQAFVRESWKQEATLDEFYFGSKRAAFVRGKDVVLAAIISRGDPAYLVPQLRAAVHALERVHGPVLANWDGRLSRIDRAQGILETLMQGGYRGEAWKEWVDEAKDLFHRPR